MRHRRHVVVGVVIALIGVAAAIVFAGKFRTYTYTFTCTVCHQDWQTNNTTLWGVPVWYSTGSHVATTHPPTYTGGGFSRESWTIIGGTRVIACGGHSMHSP